MKTNTLKQHLSAIAPLGGSANTEKQRLARSANAAKARAGLAAKIKRKKRARITKVGTITKDAAGCYHVSGWHFNGGGGVINITAEGCMGYTWAELEERVKKQKAVAARRNAK